VKVNLGETQWTPTLKKADRERWNDWGIGLLLQAIFAARNTRFSVSCRWTPPIRRLCQHRARLVQEGETDAARPYLEKR